MSDQLQNLVEQAESIKDADWSQIAAFSQAHKVTDQKTLDDANEFLIKLKQLEKEAKSNEKSFTAGLKDTIKKIESVFKPKFDNISSAISNISSKILAYKQEQERLAKEEARQRELKAEEDRKAAVKKLEEEAALNDSLAAMFGEEEPTEQQVQKQIEIEVVKQQPVKVEPIKTGMTRTKSGSTSVVKRWTYEVTDIAALASARPDLIMDNSVLINAAIRNDEREIPGLRIYQKESLSVR